MKETIFFLLLGALVAFGAFGLWYVASNSYNWHQCSAAGGEYLKAPLDLFYQCRFEEIDQ